jgi:hypothetical protein
MDVECAMGCDHVAQMKQGWYIPRYKGLNALALMEDVQTYAHVACVNMVKRGMSVAQQSML